MCGSGSRATCTLASAVHRLLRVLFAIAMTALQFIVACHRPRQKLAAENLFLRKQLALFQERKIKPRREDDVTRATLVWLSGAFNWREALVVVKPATLIRWHREGFRQHWKRKSRPGRPVLPYEVRILIRQMASDNPTWGEERIADELLLKLGLRVSPRTVRKYIPDHPGDGPGRGVTDQRWITFVRKHAEGIVACDFFTVVTATFRVLYVFVVVEHASCRILHFNVTRHPTGDWTLQQLWEAIPDDHSYGFLIRDRDGKFSQRLDESIRRLRLQVLKTPVRTPRAKVHSGHMVNTLFRRPTKIF
jgi:putative transposase